MMQGMGFGMGFGWLLWLVLVIAIIWAVKAVIESQSRNVQSSREQDRALDILRERLARGEIDTSEFEEKRKKLTS